MRSSKKVANSTKAKDTKLHRRGSESIKELRRICQKPGEIERVSLYSYLHRYPSIYLTKLFLHTPFTANQVTFLLVLLTIPIGYLFYLGEMWSYIAGLALAYFIAVLDRVDGEMARYDQKTSMRGVYLDALMHITILLAIWSGLTTSVYLQTGSLLIIVFGASALMFSLAQSASADKKAILTLEGELKSLRIKGSVGRSANPVSSAPRKGKGLQVFIKKYYQIPSIPQGYFKEFLLIFVLFSRADLFIIFFGVYMPLYWLLYVTVTSISLK
ncbi:CDP-alcohol phosphatidyltransferase family protein [Candidatus Woesearchaeota archaeon]|nr:CDP-alcohol phosphatidyltransferase family protein [Candidatus Woesearchaeota archaeon]